jgi:large subunit ribosomal protein L2
MTLKTYRPVTPGQRGLVLVDRSGLWKGRPHKGLVEGKRSTGGRSLGRVTMRHRGGGHKRLYRMVDFKRADAVGCVERIEYDPNRSAFIALIKNEETDTHAYIIAPDTLSVGDRVSAGSSTEIKTGNTLQLKNAPVGILVHNIELKIGKGGQMARSAGASAQIMGRDGAYVLLRLPSGEVRKVHGDCRATVGVVSNGDHKNRCVAKAGRNRWLGRRPHVRGVAMNPIDHPHGGGEGKTSGGRHPVTPWGKPTKGYKTRNKKKASGKMIVTRRKK